MSKIDQNYLSLFGHFQVPSGVKRKLICFVKKFLIYMKVNLMQRYLSLTMQQIQAGKYSTNQFNISIIGFATLGRRTIAHFYCANILKQQQLNTLSNFQLNHFYRLKTIIINRLFLVIVILLNLTCLIFKNPQNGMLGILLKVYHLILLKRTI